jgi:nucleotide-binding universal stress UspA family protein
VFGKILVPLDGSRLAARIVHPLRRLLGVDAEVTLLRVAEPGRTDDPRRGPAVEADLRREMMEVCETLGTGVRAEVVVVDGDPAEEIVRHARETKQDLVAMATHGYSGVERWVRGSVAERVLRRCEVPLLLCNPHGLEPRPDRAEGEFRRILVPLDGSPVADQVLPAVAEVARRNGSHVTLLRVEPLILTEFPSPIVEGSLWDPAPLERALDPQREQLVAAGVDVEVRAVYGVIAAEILEAARSADLLAMTSHGRSGIARWWFGSVAEQVLRHVTCPLLVLRHVPAARPAARALTSADARKREQSAPGPRKE